MPDALVNVNGNWITAKEVWVKRSGTWQKSTSVYMKIDGVWTLVEAPPGPAPDPPIVSLQVGTTKHISVGVRNPGANDDPSVEQIRVLVSRTEMPTSQFGSGTVAEPDNQWPDENWSNWFFANHYNDKGLPAVHPDTSIADEKKYPPNATADTPPLPAGQWYYFAAWTKSTTQQWSLGTFTKVFVPTGTVTGVIAKEAVFEPNATGSMIGLNGVTWQPSSNDMVVLGNSSKGVAFFGNKITDAVGQDGTVGNFAGSVRITRGNDSGSPTANVWAFWHDVSAIGDVALGHQFNKTNIGTIAKGQSKSLDLPASWDSHWNLDIKGIGFGWSTTPVVGDNSTLKGTDSDVRSAEINLNWTETP